MGWRDGEERREERLMIAGLGQAETQTRLKPELQLRVGNPSLLATPKLVCIVGEANFFISSRPARA